MSMNEKSASQQIDDIINNAEGWKGDVLAKLRKIIKQSDPDLLEEVKWKKPSRPEGVPVWTLNGNICIAESLKSAVRLTFPKGAQLQDPKQLFNTRLDSKSVRAIDIFENSAIDETGIKDLITRATQLNRYN